MAQHFETGDLKIVAKWNTFLLNKPSIDRLMSGPKTIEVQLNRRSLSNCLSQNYFLDSLFSEEEPPKHQHFSILLRAGPFRQSTI